ncbi:MAG: hypothetical protein ACI9KA_001193 [Parasphingorhabdus sp.]|jgi:hypothetical protein|nr:hypothetical protein [Sphingomonadales bacterium]
MPKHCDRRATLRWAKLGPPPQGRVGKPAGGVAALAWATSPRCTPLLASGLPDAMTTFPLP